MSIVLFILIFSDSEQLLIAKKEKNPQELKFIGMSVFPQTTTSKQPSSVFANIMKQSPTLLSSSLGQVSSFKLFLEIAKCFEK